MEAQEKCNKRNVVKFAGAFIAWTIGAGFATGQEILQFFTSYGYLSYGVVILNLFGFLFFGQVLLVTGYENKAKMPFNQCKYFCGEKLGAFYSWLIPSTLILIMPVLISGAGTTFYEFYGTNRYIGSAIMTVMVLCAYLIGFEKLIKIVSTIGPIIIIFTLFVGVYTVINEFKAFTEVSKYGSILSESRPAPHWIISSVLYLSLSFVSGSVYFTGLGMSADSRKDAKYGAIFGAVTVIVAIAIMNSAILLNSEYLASSAIPMLYLARKVSYGFGAVFSVILILGMFSSCSAMMWSVCSRFAYGGDKGNRIFAILIAIFAYVLSLFSFAELVGFFYPLEGYIGLIFIGCVAYKGIKHQF